MWLELYSGIIIKEVKNVDEKITTAKELVEKYNQGHLLNYINELSKDKIDNLVEQILEIDFELTMNLFDNACGESKAEVKLKKDISPIKSDVCELYDSNMVEEFRRIGEEQLSQTNVAVITMAGGQGTRLGHNGPKGTFRIDGSRDNTLFKLQTDRLFDLHIKNKKWVPWYIMTSEENHRETISYFEENNYFNYNRNYIFFFKQEMMPLINTKGEIILKNKDEIYLGPNGNGGVFFSLKKSGAIDDMLKKHIKWVFICGIDNALVKIADPVFIGYTIKSQKGAGSKSVVKKHPQEKVGVFCRENNKPSIVEYTELPIELIDKTNSEGELLYGDANIIAHLFSIDKVTQIADKGLPYHVAFKKISYLNGEGEFTNPNAPNVYKFESFIFDAFQYLDDMAILRVKRELEFAPIKNSSGEDSPESALALLKLNNLI